MATKTPNLGLIKPAQGEYEDTWHIPLNKDLDTLDGAVGDLQTEVVDARGIKASLNERLSVALKTNGELNDVPEIAVARISTVYGTAASLDERLELGDREIYDAREGAASLRDAKARNFSDVVSDSITSAPVGFLSFTGANVKVDGSVTPVVVDINGYRQVVRVQKQATVSGSAGTYYIYLQRSASGEIFINRTGVGVNTGATGVDTNTLLLNKFTDTTQNFLTSGVQAGDILEITSVGSTVIGQYVVASVVDSTNLLVVGLFAATQSNLNYKITNPISPSLGFTATAHANRWAAESNRIYVGRAVFDGTNVTSVIAYSAKGRFEQFVSISLSGGNFSQTISHNLGYMPRKVHFLASQTNDFSAALEPLSVGDMTTSTLLRSVVVKMDPLTVSVKNATSNVFYKSFDGTTQTSGYLLVIAER